MSFARNVRCGKAARSSRARVSLSLGATFVGISTASRHTMASLFMLRRCISAAVFKRSYTASGMFFKVKVVGIAFAPEGNQSGSIVAHFIACCQGCAAG
jgi:hypothetical protein